MFRVTRKHSYNSKFSARIISVVILTSDPHAIDKLIIYQNCVTTNPVHLQDIIRWQPQKLPWLAGDLEVEFRADFRWIREL